MYEMSVSGRGRDPFQQNFDVCTDSDGLGWVELFFILLSADVWVSVNYCEEVYERYFEKSKFMLQSNSRMPFLRQPKLITEFS